jgi:hypothetical protein
VKAETHLLLAVLWMALATVLYALGCPLAGAAADFVAMVRLGCSATALVRR